ncbi:MAG: phosphoribosylanthranilate isomerase [Betaproteobacteria bacterium]|nr:phosphoribosylanthranilate isomerase [Betaproteobacteria bacterium]
MRTRIKICGITRLEDARAAAEHGADAIGFIQWRKSPRFVEPVDAGEIAHALPPMMSTVLVFVNPTREEVAATLRAMPFASLQFHGDEDADFCASFARPWIKAAGAKPDRDLVKYFQDFKGASAWLVDEYHDKLYGGTGRKFDWNRVPRNPARPLILSGGLGVDNVDEAIHTIRPYAVDISSSVEVAKGIKDAARIAAFISEVRRADQRFS